MIILLDEVKKITNQFVILQSMDGLKQIMAEKENLTSFFETEKVPQLEPSKKRW